MGKYDAYGKDFLGSFIYLSGVDLNKIIDAYNNGIVLSFGYDYYTDQEKAIYEANMVNEIEGKSMKIKGVNKIINKAFNEPLDLLESIWGFDFVQFTIADNPTQIKIKLGFLIKALSIGCYTMDESCTMVTGYRPVMNFSITGIRKSLEALVREVPQLETDMLIDAAADDRMQYSYGENPNGDC